MTTDIDAAELHRRLSVLDTHLAGSAGLFDRYLPLELGPPAESAALESTERALGVELPAPLRGFLLEHAGSGRFGYLLRSEHEADRDADYGGADGGFELLDPERMRRDHARIRRTTLGPGESWPFVPFVKDPNEATWLCVVRTPEGDRIAHVFHDEAVEEAERWSLDGFFDAWSAAGFRTGPRWEDQPDAIVERFREALGIVEPVDPE